MTDKTGGRRAVLISSAFLAVVVIAAIVVPLAFNSGKVPGHAIAVSQPGPWQLGSDRISPYGNGIDSWVVGDDLVLVNDTYAVAYARSDGKERWRIPSPSGHFCGASTSVVDNHIAVGYGDHCSSAAVLDVNAGKLLWQRAMPITSSGSPSEAKLDEHAVLEIVGGSVVVVHYQQLLGLDAATGAVRWSEVTPPTDEKVYSNCIPSDGMRRSADFVLLSHCSAKDSGNNLYVAVAVDPATGKTKQHNEFVKSTSYLTMAWVSTSPLVAYLSDASKGLYETLDDSLEPVSTIEAGDALNGFLGDDGFGYSLSGISNGTSHRRSRALVTGTTMIALTSPQKPNRLAAFDLRTGAKRWDAPAPGGGIVAAPLAVDNGQVIAVVSAGQDSPDQHIVKFALDTGAVTPVRTVSLTGSGDRRLAPWFCRLFWADGVVFGVRGIYSGQSTALVFRLG